MTSLTPILPVIYHAHCLVMSHISTLVAIILCFILAVPAATAQELGHAQGEVIVQLSSKKDARQLAADNQRFEHKTTGLKPAQLLSKELNIWKLSFDYTLIHEKFFLEHLQKEPGVITAQLNHRIDLRSTTPDDPQFDNQWQYLNTGQVVGATSGADLDIDLAWDVTQGGTTPRGDTIVVCIIDNGQETTHEDFEDNLWINHSEIPNNGLDDDGNGFVDDYRGWNVSRDNDEIDAENFHGTPVAGIIGAKGNNGKGVAGVNWNIKLMIVTSDFPSTEAEVLQAYGYALAARKRYNETNGREGAFVVATNASWGIPNARPEDSPIWCSFYDQLGLEGILNVVATDNSELNVDEDGDMPSSCPSDYIISVTNVGADGQKVRGAGFGKTMVDLGAFGGERSSGAWTVSTSNQYGPFDGTSASTPHVSGALALLYAAPCPSISELALADPAVNALIVKDLLLKSVIPNPSLQDLTVTGGHLNINSSLQYLLENCADCIPVTSVTVASPSDTEAVIDWTTNPGISQVNLRWKPTDSDDWQVEENINAPFQLLSLSGCTEYEFQLQSQCGEEMLDYSTSTTFSTLGCCEPPTAINFLRIEETLAFGEWDAVFGANQYRIRYRESGTEDWIETMTFGNNFVFNDLTSCTIYEIEFTSVCDESEGDSSEDLLTFSTLGCGACFESDYCQPRNLNAREEWIASVRIDTFENITQSDDGYGDYTGMGTIQLEQDKTIEFELTPGFAEGILFNEFFNIWIDLDQNGLFSSSELLWSMEDGTTSTISASIRIPGSALLGNTRLRIGMTGLFDRDACPFSVTKFGEFEDYCVEVVKTTSTSTSQQNINHPVFEVFPNPTGPDGITVQTKFPTIIKVIYLEIFSSDGTLHHSQQIDNHPANITQNQKLETANLVPGVYFLRLRSSGKKTLVRKLVVP